MKAIWTGSISFGLVNIDIRLYSAIQEHTMDFKLLCKRCHMPITYQRWCSHCKKQVIWHDVVKGLKLADGSYAILTQEKIHELRPLKTETISIKEFVTSSQIMPIYLENHYYLGPSKSGERGYFLFKQALENTDKVAIGTFVMRDKEYTCAITPYEDVLLLSTLHYAYEIRSVEEITGLKSSPKLEKQELKLAEQLVTKLTHKKFDLTKYKDTFAQELAKVLKRSKKTKPKTEKIPKTTAKKQKSPTLISSLKASLIAPSKSRQPVARARKK